MFSLIMHGRAVVEDWAEETASRGWCLTLQDTTRDGGPEQDSISRLQASKGASGSFLSPIYRLFPLATVILEHGLLH